MLMLVKGAATRLIQVGKCRRRRQVMNAEHITGSHEESVRTVSVAQERIWLDMQLGAHPSLYNTTVAYEVRESCNLSALGTALNEVVKRHEVLRSQFSEVDGRLVLSTRSAELRAVTERKMSESEEVHEWIAREREQDILCDGFPFRALILRRQVGRSFLNERLALGQDCAINTA